MALQSSVLQPTAFLSELFLDLVVLRSVFPHCDQGQFFSVEESTELSGNLIAREKLPEATVLAS
jgi:hypothetical protein